MEYRINMGRWGNIFAVPSVVVDEYIKLASGQAIKVLLCFLRMGELKTEDVSKALGIDEEAVTDAIAFWEQVGLFDESESVRTSEADKIKEEPDKAEHEIPKAKQSSKRSLPPKEIAERINNSDEIKFLFSTAENAFGHLLNNTEQNSLLWIHDYLGMKTDILVMLFEYCKVYGKMSMSYIERSAASWQEKEILTHEQAEDEIRKAKNRLILSGRVKNAFGIDRNFTPTEKKYITEWTDLDYDIELIKYAYEKTIDAIGKLSFAYINKILKSWYEKGLTSRVLIDGADSERPKYTRNSNSKEDKNTKFYEEDPFEDLAVNIKRYKKKFEGEDNE